MTWQPPQNIGDNDSSVSAAKKVLRKYSYGIGLGDSRSYTDEFRVALIRFQQNVNALIDAGKRATPRVNTHGVLDWATKVQLGLIERAVSTSPPQRAKPVLFTVEGHMSSMWVGPAAELGRVLEAEGLVRWQPTGYNNTKLPFDNDSGVNELARLLGDEVLLPRGTRWGTAIFSQGAIVGSQLMMRHVFPAYGKLHWRLKDWAGTVSFGSPYRERDVVAEWVADPPRAGTQGISDERMAQTPSRWKEVARRGDLYTENEVSDAGEHKTAIYKAVQNQWSGGPDSLLMQLIEIGQRPTVETIAVVQAIVSGVMFLGNMSPHGGYDLAPCLAFLRRSFDGN